MQSELTQWVELYTEYLYSWAYHKVSDIELAKDIVQETFLVATEKINSFKKESSPKTWLTAILNNKIIDYYRKKATQPVNVDNQDFSYFFDDNGDWVNSKKPKQWNNNSNLLDDSGFQQILKKCMDALPDQWSASVKLKYLMNKKGDEICQELNISPSNYWQIVHRAKLQLRECIENKWFKAN
ncbi:MAG: sigma-70 family RNA polymerase sigma factor [Chlorobi bacterium]|nr:sigma-70 family RNA polymerase sigma factor [Chlorobiota bacterium]